VIYSLVTVGLLLVPADIPMSKSEIMTEAEEAFAEGLRRREAGEKSRALFGNSAWYYEMLHAEGANNALLYRNLGNARLLAGDLPGAILAYRLGLRLEPGNPVLRQNLEYARGRVVFREGSMLGRPAADVRPDWLAARGAGWLFALAVLAWTSGWLVVARWLMRRRRSLLLAGVGLLAIALGMGVLLFQRERTAPDRPIVVLAADGVLLRKGDSRLFPPRYETPLNRGVEAELLFRRGGWLQIELSGGEVGWIPATDAVVEEG
jgi:hypothetical protein